MVSQQFSPVCWLASALMVLQFKRGMTLTTEELCRRAGLQGPDFRSTGLTVADEFPGGSKKQATLRRLGFTGTRFSELAGRLTRDREATVRLAHAQRQGRPLATAAPPRRTRGAPGTLTRPAAASGEEAMYWVLENHGPFVLLHFVGSFSYGPNVPIPPGALGTGHAVVVTGFFPQRHRVTFNNPWGQRDVPTTAASIEGAIRRFEATSSGNIAIFWL